MFKNIIQIIGISILACFSFYYTEKLIDISKSKDSLMQTIISNQDKYTVASVSATVKGNKIIPGIRGYKVNVNKSYNNMKRLGIFNEYFLVYDEIHPKLSIDSIYDKYIISGNKNKRNVALLFTSNDNEVIKKAINVLDNKKVVGNFFIDGYWGENNIELLNRITSNNNFLGNLGYNSEYDNPSILYTNSLISRITKQSKLYCLLDNENEKILNICKNKKMWTIVPTLNLSDNLYNNIKSNIVNGSIILIKLDSNNVKELEVTINYLKQKGYNILSLDKLLEE